MVSGDLWENPAVNEYMLIMIMIFIIKLIFHCIFSLSKTLSGLKVQKAVSA